LAVPDLRLKILIGNCLIGILEDPNNHKYVARIDIKNIISLLRLSNENMVNLGYVGLKLLNKLSAKDEFLDAFQAEKLEQILIEVLSRQISIDINIESLDILTHMLNSIYVKETVVSICQIENNLGLEIITKLCLPPTNENVPSLNHVNFRNLPSEQSWSGV
jgi:hypothetical protein